MMAFILFIMQLFVVHCISVLPPSPPPFSWDKVPLFIHAGNQSGPLNETAAKYMARFPLATIEKMQDDEANPVCEAKSTKPCEEDRIIAALKAIRSYNSETRTMFYLNSLLNFPQYNLSTQFLGENEKYLLHDKNGKMVYWGQCAAKSPNVTVFDLSQNETINLWLNTIKYAMTAASSENGIVNGIVDGAFVDRGNTNMSSTSHCIALTAEKQEQWNKGHTYMLQQAQILISSINKDRGILIANNADFNVVNARMFEKFSYNDPAAVNENGNSDDILALMNENNKRISECHGENTDYGSGVYNQTLTAFLIGAAKYSYYACSKGWTLQTGWDTMWQNVDYNKDLGEPISDAVYNNKTKVYYREFKSATKVYIGLEWTSPCIKWSDGTITGTVTDCNKY